MLEQSRQAKERDWAGLLVPLLLVIAFVLLLIKLV
jgi:flagellar biogenesis protein FliO